MAALYGDLLYRGWLDWKQRKREEREGWISAADLLADGGRKWRLTVQLLLGIGLVIFSGWLGGQLVYEFGVGVR